MEEVVEEKKPFDHEIIKDEEDTQPEPDEVLGMNGLPGKVWAVKIPKHVMEQWKTVTQPDIELATVRVYDKDPRSGKQRIVLIMPSTPEAPNEPGEEFELDMVQESVENQLLIASSEKTPGSRARQTMLTGKVKHEINMRPLFNENYRKRMRARHKAANTPVRQIRLIDEVIPGRGGVNMLTSGIAAASGFSSLIKAKQKPVKGAFERFARMPRNQLLDLLFAYYREKPRWSARELRTKTEQPESYLKEILAEIADLHRSGEFNGMYELKPNFKDSPESAFAASQSAPAALGSDGANMKMEVDVEDDMVDDDDDDDDNDDDDADMEEIS